LGWHIKAKSPKGGFWARKPDNNAQAQGKCNQYAQTAHSRYYVLCIMHDATSRPPKNPSECHEKSTPGVIY